MHKVSSVTFFLFFVLFTFGCSTGGSENKDKGSSADTDAGAAVGTPSSQVNEVIVYGSRTCPHCVAFMNKLEDRGIEYKFKEVDNQDENFKEMYDKIQSVNYQGYIQYPVVEINGNIMVSPDFDDFKKRLK